MEVLRPLYIDDGGAAPHLFHLESIATCLCQFPVTCANIDDSSHFFAGTMGVKKGNEAEPPQYIVKDNADDA